MENHGAAPHSGTIARFFETGTPDMRFSDASLRALPTPVCGQKLYTDDSLPGFGLRVSTKTKTFVLTYGAERTRVSLGRYPLMSLADARRKAQTILRDRELGVIEKDVP